MTSSEGRGGIAVAILTERLCPRPLRADDLPAFVAYRSAPDVARHESYSMADAERFRAR